MPFTVSPGDADRAEHNIEKIMAAIAAMLDRVVIPPYVKEPQPEVVDGELMDKPESLGSGTEDGAERLALSGANDPLLGGRTQEALPMSPLGEFPKLDGQQVAQLREATDSTSPAQVKLQMGNVTAEGTYGDDLQASLAQLSVEDLERLQQALESPPQIEDGVIDVEAETVEIEIDGVAYSSHELLAQEKPTPIHTDVLPVEEIESRPGNDFSNSSSLGEVAPVVVQVDDQGRILDSVVVKQQVESRVEDAHQRDEIDQQRTEPSTPDQSKAAQTLQQFFEATGLDRFEGDRFVLEQQGELMTITAKDGRGLIFAVKGEDVVHSRLSQEDAGQLELGRSILARYGAIEESAPPIQLSAAETDILTTLRPRPLELEL